MRTATPRGRPASPPSDIIDCGDGTAKVAVGLDTFATIDAEDISKAEGFRWRISKDPNRNHHVVCPPTSRQKYQKLTHAILGLKREHVIHLNGDSLDCRKSNLMLRTESLIPRIRDPEQVSGIKIIGDAAEVSLFCALNNEVSIVDLADVSLVAGRRWSLNRQSTVNYAVCSRAGVGPMHRYLLNAPEGWHVDHRNRDGLDNRRSNLRVCNRSQNAMNSKKPRRRNKNPASWFKGVSCLKGNNSGKPWAASITIDGKMKHLGCFETEEAAARAYDLHAVIHFGEFARTNFTERNELV